MHQPRRAHQAARLVGVLAAGALPSLCHAATRQPSGLGRIAAAALTLGWLLLTLLLFTMLRRPPARMRYVASGLFLAAPFVGFAVTDGWVAMTEPHAFTPQAAAPTLHTSDAPVAMGGATFPAGSRIALLMSGVHGTTARLAAVEADRPVALGVLSIRAIHRVAGDTGDTYGTRLAFDQRIDGWPCAAISDQDTVLRVANPRLPKPALVSCQLAGTVTIGAVAWPPATVVRRNPHGGWTLLWQARTFSQVDRAKAFAFDVDSMSGDYDAARAMQAWAGTLHDVGEVQVGDVRFGGKPAPVLTWQADGAIRVTGRGVDVKNGAQENCVAVSSTKTGPRYRRCVAETPVRTGPVAADAIARTRAR